MIFFDGGKQSKKQNKIKRRTHTHTHTHKAQFYHKHTHTHTHTQKHTEKTLSLSLLCVLKTLSCLIQGFTCSTAVTIKPSLNESFGFDTPSSLCLMQVSRVFLTCACIFIYFY